MKTSAQFFYNFPFGKCALEYRFLLPSEVLQLQLTSGKQSQVVGERCALAHQVVLGQLKSSIKHFF